MIKKQKKCWCDWIREYSKALGDWAQHRLVDSARAEIDEAKKSKYDYIIINVWEAHAFHGLKHAKQMWFNYYVIAPNWIVPAHVQIDPILKTKEKIRANNAVCKWEASNPDSKLTQLINVQITEAKQRGEALLREAEQKK